MSAFWIKALQLLLSLSLLIVLHEGGHYVAARIFKTRVEKFFLFFDVNFALFKKKIGDTVYGIGWLPLGGYVKISGMIDESMDKEQMAKPPEPWEFRSKPAWQRLIIMLGGVTVNLILGFFIFMMIQFHWGKNVLPVDGLPNGLAVSEHMQKLGFQNGDLILEVNGEPLEDQLKASSYLMLRDVKTMTTKHQDGEIEQISIPKDYNKTLFAAGEMLPFSPIVPAVIDSVFADTPAEKAGLKKGDKITAVNGKEIDNMTELNQIKDEAPGEKLYLQVVSNGVQKEFEITPNEENNIGIYPQINYTPKHITYTFGESISEGFSYTYWTLRDYIAQFKFVFTKKGATQVGGFGTIGSLFPPVWDWQSFWHTTAFISIILAFMNILPIPALDGGHVMFLLYEMITGRKPHEKVLEVAQIIGILILLTLVIYANGNDIYRYFFE
ncbi:MAG TPA: RIP metalloprotease RseP [Flavobacteriaceae bacterium]|nr:RIP metalloprotease RseP [Flavobacteriaceae bacterium]